MYALRLLIVALLVAHATATVFQGNVAPIIIDATRMINESLPGDLDAKLKPQRLLVADTQKMSENGYAKQTHVLAGGAGTHVDSPAHVCGGAYVVCARPGPYRTIEQMRPDEMVGPLRVVDVRAKAAVNPNYLVTVQDVRDHIQAHGRIRNRSWVIMDSGWSKYAYNETAYKNIGADGKNHHPGWSGEAVQWLIDHTNFNGIGVDTLSVDKGESWTYEAHATNMGSDRFAVESVDLSDPLIPPKGAWATITPTKIQGAPESSARVLILLNRD